MAVGVVVAGGEDGLGDGLRAGLGDKEGDLVVDGDGEGAATGELVGDVGLTLPPLLPEARLHLPPQ